MSKKIYFLCEQKDSNEYLKRQSEEGEIYYTSSIFFRKIKFHSDNLETIKERAQEEALRSKEKHCIFSLTHIIDPKKPTITEIENEL